MLLFVVSFHVNIIDYSIFGHFFQQVPIYADFLHFPFSVFTPAFQISAQPHNSRLWSLLSAKHLEDLSITTAFSVFHIH